MRSEAKESEIENFMRGHLANIRSGAGKVISEEYMQPLVDYLEALMD